MEVCTPGKGCCLEESREGWLTRTVVCVCVEVVAGFHRKEDSGTANSG